MQPTGWFGLWKAGDTLTLRNIENNNDYAIYTITSVQFMYSPGYNDYVEVNINPLSLVLIGNTSFSDNATYSFSFAKKGADSTVPGPKGPTGADSTYTWT